MPDDNRGLEVAGGQPAGGAQLPLAQTLTLPYPPTANNLFINVAYGRKKGGRIKAPEYRAWLDRAGKALMLQKPRRIAGPVRVLVVAMRPDKRKRDIANLEKPLLDLLVKHGVIEDDSIVESLTLEWTSDNLSGVSVTITSLAKTTSFVGDTP